MYQFKLVIKNMIKHRPYCSEFLPPARRGLLFRKVYVGLSAPFLGPSDGV